MASGSGRVQTACHTPSCHVLQIPSNMATDIHICSPMLLGYVEVRASAALLHMFSLERQVSHPYTQKQWIPAGLDGQRVCRHPAIKSMRTSGTRRCMPAFLTRTSSDETRACGHCSKAFRTVFGSSQMRIASTHTPVWIFWD
jgi:hypothetical protein